MCAYCLAILKTNFKLQKYIVFFGQIFYLYADLKIFTFACWKL